MASETILVVDDNEMNLKLIEAVLSGEGYDVTTAVDAQTTFAALARQRPDLVLIDVQLPDVDGLEVTRRLRADPATSGLRIVALTAYAMTGDEDKARAAGCDGYITKPIDTRTLPNVIAGYLARKSAPRQPAPADRISASVTPITEASRPLVLIVEDDPHLNRFLVAALSEEFRTASAGDGKDGLDKALALRPDLILSDVVMPRMTGMELLAELRSRSEFDTTPVIVLSGQEDGALRVKMLNDAQDYVLKPCSAQEIVARVKNLVTMKRVRDVLQAELSSRRDSLEELATEVSGQKRDLRVALESLRAAHAYAERMSQFKTTLLTLFSHELRTPITALLLQVERLKRDRHGELAPAHRQMVDGVASAAGRLGGIVESLLEYAHLEAGRLVPHLATFDVNELGAEVVDELRPQATRKDLDIDFRPAASLPPLTSDRQVVRIILVNLIGNAIKFTERGSVSLTAARAGGGHSLTVTDTGPGVAEADRERIFEPFVQLEALRHKHHPGFGLGLSLVREMSAALGCRLEMSSELGRGSSFTVTFPGTC